MPDDDAVDYTELIEQFKRAGQLPIIWQWTVELTRFRGHPRRGVYGCHGEAEAAGVHS